MKATIRLFKAVPITRGMVGKLLSKELLTETIEKGFVFSPEVVSSYSDLKPLIKLVEEELGLTGEQLNASFHKSWGKVKDASIEQLVFEQIVHYITTYGFKELGIYDDDSIYIPHEKLEIPELDEDIKLTIIKGYTKAELKKKILALVNTGIALKEETMHDIIEVADLVGLSAEEVHAIKNKEVKVALYDYFGIFPENGIDFLRYVVYKATGKSLLIKNTETVDVIKAHNNFEISVLFGKYKDKYGFKRLAEIFYRFKPLFLAFKTNAKLKTFINKIRKLAKTCHKPLPEDYLNTITARLKNDGKDGKECILNSKLKEELKKVNVFRKIRLAYALNFRLTNPTSILYKIRNGKSYVTEFTQTFKPNVIIRILATILESIQEDVTKNVKGKKIYIPEEMKYALPATEKQFTGDFPSGTYIVIPKDMVFGIHWENVKSHVIDLDLSTIDVGGQKIGWDANYRTEGRDIMFSGDITSAPKPKGASELFYVARQNNNSLILYVNYYNYDEAIEVPFKIIVGSEQPGNFGSNYMINPNNVKAIAKTMINTKQKILGLVTTTPTECRFYFTESNMGNSITSSGSETAEKSRNYLFNFYSNAISLNDILESSGAELVDDKSECDIDLSPENIGKDTIINLLVGTNGR